MRPAAWPLALVILIAAAGDAAASRAVAILEAVSGRIEVSRGGQWYRAREGVELALGDRVRTKGDSLARLRFLDDSRATVATTVDMTPDTELDIARFEIEKTSAGPRRTGFLSMLRGAIRTLTKGWQHGSVFAVKAGTTVCGIRGSVADISFDPETGRASFTGLAGEIFTFAASDLDSAIAFAVRAGVDLAAGRTVEGVFPLVPGTARVEEGPRVRTVVLSPEQRSRLLAVSATAAAADGRAAIAASLAEARAAIDEMIPREEGGDEPPPPRFPGRGPRADGGGPGDEGGAEAVLDSIVQELTGDAKVNAPVSDG